MASTRRSSMVPSFTLAAVPSTASGVPCPSATRWSCVPGLPRSVGFGPVLAPLFHALGGDARGLRPGPAPVPLSGVGGVLQQRVGQALPHGGPLPNAQAGPQRPTAPTPLLAG